MVREDILSFLIFFFKSWQIFSMLLRLQKFLTALYIAKEKVTFFLTFFIKTIAKCCIMV